MQVITQFADSRRACKNVNVKLTVLSFVVSLLLGLFGWGFDVAFPKLDPVWGQFAMLLSFLGLAVTAFIAWRDRQNFLPQSMTSSYPDTPIGEVFFHIDPEVLDRKGSRWEKVGRKIRDFAANGALTIWGRPFNCPGIPDDYLTIDSGGTLQRIDADYWKKADFSYQFFAPENQYRAHTYPEDHKIGFCYSDLRVSKIEALKIWPEKVPLDASDHSLRWALSVPVVLVLAGSALIGLPQIHTALKPLDPAYGMLSLQELKIDKIEDQIGIRMFLRNTSTDYAMQILPQWSSVEINGTLYPATTIDPVPPLAPGETARLRLPLFPISNLKMVGRESLLVRFRLKYGYVGTTAENVMCEIEHCSFIFVPPNKMGSQSCFIELCK